MTTRLGRSVECTLTHPFLTIDGWKRLGELAPGAPVAVPRNLPAFGHEAMPEGPVKVLAYLIGDGCLTDGCPEFTNSNPRLREDFIESLAAFPGTKDGSKIRTARGRRPFASLPIRQPFDPPELPSRRG